MRISPRCERCDCAFEMGLSEKEFLERFDEWERAQILGTYRSKGDRAFVMGRFPMPRPKD